MPNFQGGRLRLSDVLMLLMVCGGVTFWVFSMLFLILFASGQIEIRVIPQNQPPISSRSD